MGVGSLAGRRPLDVNLQQNEEFGEIFLDEGTTRANVRLIFPLSIEGSRGSRVDDGVFDGLVGRRWWL